MQENILLEIFPALGIILSLYALFNRRKLATLWANYYKKFYDLECDEKTIKKLNIIILIFLLLFLVVYSFGFIAVLIQTNDLWSFFILWGLLGLIFNRQFTLIHIKHQLWLLGIKNRDSIKVTKYARIYTVIGSIFFIILALFAKIIFK